MPPVPLSDPDFRREMGFFLFFSSGFFLFSLLTSGATTKGVLVVCVCVWTGRDFHYLILIRDDMGVVGGNSSELPP